MKAKVFYISLFILIFWIIITGRISLENVIVGILITLLITRLNLSVILDIINKPYFKLKKFSIFFRYILLLLWEIVIANFQVAMIVLSPKIKIEPVIIHHRTKLKDSLLKTILANSITLTPGTFTIEVMNDVFSIHCLTTGHAEGVKNSKLEKLLLEIEG